MLLLFSGTAWSSTCGSRVPLTAASHSELQQASPAEFRENMGQVPRNDILRRRRSPATVMRCSNFSEIRITPGTHFVAVCQRRVQAYCMMRREALKVSRNLVVCVFMAMEVGDSSAVGSDISLISHDGSAAAATLNVMCLSASSLVWMLPAASCRWSLLHWQK